jgi:excisionase family DNA binding protein
MGVEKLLLTTEEAARRLGIGRSAVYDLIRTKKLKTLKIGARRLVPIESLHEVVALLLEEAA